MAAVLGEFLSFWSARERNCTTVEGRALWLKWTVCSMLGPGREARDCFPWEAGQPDW